MSVVSRSATRALYRDFYDLIPLFSSFSARPILKRPSRCASLPITRTITSTPRRRLHVEARQHSDAHEPLRTPSAELTKPEQHEKQRRLPLACPGCGALTQSLHPQDAGHYSLERAAVRRYLDPKPSQPAKEESKEDEVMRNALANVPEDLRAQFGLDATMPSERYNDDISEPATPICDRCHHLVHHHSGIPIHHPSLDAIAATIEESPHKYNHIYHVIDAADFPLSFIPALTRRLDFGWLRGRNRRSKTQHWSKGKSGEMSFIITRSDLLAPRKEQVDALMPQMREMLRDALGKRTGENLRLGNVHLVSSKRGWWTREVKADVWQRGGANWLVGQANVGKSNIFEVIYPKGTNEATPNFRGVRDEAKRADVQAALAVGEEKKVELLSDDAANQIGMAGFEPTTTNDTLAEIEEIPEETAKDGDFYNTSSLLPPPQSPTNYPVMPTISSLPGTTASPIRIPFGSGKGELIDLPGMERRTLEPYVRPEHHLDIVMKRRITPERLVLKPGTSLVLGGGLVRITPKTDNLVFMVHAFVPMSAHVTSTVKAIALQNGERELNIPSIIAEDKRDSLANAGTFKLESNVTRKFAGPLTRRSDVGLRAARLPFVVWATDILVQGVGWVEVVAQVRKPRRGSWLDEGAFEAERVVEARKSDEDHASWSPINTASEAPSSDDLSESSSSWTPPTTSNANSSPILSKTTTRRKDKTPEKHALDLSPEELAQTMPEIEVFSPEGKFVDQRPSLSCWLLGGPLDNKKTPGQRPRKSMKGVKRTEKRKAREATSSS